MEQFTTGYWNNRAKSFGHTGHSEPFYYCFDQQARLFAIQEILNGLDIPKRAVLDFGCGSGDFLPLLASQFNQVYALDTSAEVLEIARRKNSQPNVSFYSQLAEMSEDAKVDMIITVTVLPYLNPGELEQTLITFRRLLSPGGKIIFMEFFPKEEYLKRSGKTGTSQADWENMLPAAGFEVLFARYFYNPIVKPVPSWQRYRRHPLLILLKPFKASTRVQRVFSRIAKKLIHRYQDVLLAEESPLKIYVVEARRELV